MNHTNHKINPNDVLDTIAETSRELTQGIQPDQLTQKEKANILSELDKLEIKAHQLKLKVELADLKKLHPELEIRDVLLKMLPSLPVDIAPGILTALVDYITEQWESLGEGIVV
jgi:hypothetical protein